MAQHGDEMYFDSKSEDEIDEKQHDSIEEEDSNTDVDHGEKINNDFCCQVDAHKGVTGTVFEEDRVIHVQKYLCGEYYYVPYDICGNTDETMDILAHSTDSWSLCKNAPLLNENPNVRSDEKFDEQLLKDNRCLVHQGMLDSCEDYFVSAADLVEAQEPLKPNIRPHTDEDWKQKRKYFRNLPDAKIRCTFKHITKLGVLPPSSHLQKRFKYPNPALNLHRRNKANTTDQSSDTPAMDGVKKSTNIFVGYDSKITDVYKAKDNSGKEFVLVF